MMTVRCILVETTVPVRIRPRIETRPVKGHFLSISFQSQQIPAPCNACKAYPSRSRRVVWLLRSSFPFVRSNPSHFVHLESSQFQPFLRTYRCSCPQWQSWGYGNPDQRPCTIVVHPCPVGRSWSWSWSSRRCEAASGKRAPTGRSTRSPWHEC